MQILWAGGFSFGSFLLLLIQLGIRPDIAHNLANTSKEYQLFAKTDWIKFAINVERLRKRGLIFLSDQYQKFHIEI